jgi:transcriptional regulator GlxA family with amidase domain
MKINVLAYRGSLGSEIFGFADSLLIAQRLAQATSIQDFEPLTTRLVGVSGRTVRMANDLRIELQPPHRRPDLLVVVGFEFERTAQIHSRLQTLRAEADYIAAVFRRGTPIAAICVGAFLLAEAGVLNDRRATTAWLFAGELARLYPRVQVQTDAMFVEDGGVITTGAFSSGFDLAVHLLRRNRQIDVARMISRMTFLDAQRHTQAPFKNTALLDRSKGPFSDAVKHWLRERLATRYDLARIARAFNVSTRTLLRRFKSETGTSPLSCLQTMRIEAAKQLLISKNLRIAAVADRVGYSDPSTFVRLFGREVGHTPARYRQRFKET